MSRLYGDQSSDVEIPSQVALTLTMSPMPMSDTHLQTGTVSHNPLKAKTNKKSTNKTFQHVKKQFLTNTQRQFQKIRIQANWNLKIIFFKS